MNRPCSILLVEDDANDVFFLTRALSAAGVQVPVEVANDGAAAVQFLKDAAKRAMDPDFIAPRLVLLDLNLPRKHGLDVLRWIRQDSNWRTLQVIVLTSSAVESDIQQAYELGVSSYVVKPSDATTLRQLAEHLKGFWLGWNHFPPDTFAAYQPLPAPALLTVAGHPSH